MLPATKQQEILFFTGTTFAQTELKATDLSGLSSTPLTDKLENAFWNGLLFEMLPEWKTGDAEQEKLFRWQINNYRSFMSLNIGTHPKPVVQQFSIDPYLFSKTN